MAPKKNGDIRSFLASFQPPKPPASQTRTSRTPSSPPPSPPLPEPSSLPDVPSSPPYITFVYEPAPRAPINRDVVIAASDDEDEDEDNESFPDISLIGGPRNDASASATSSLPPASRTTTALAARQPPNNKNNPCVTPRAKRIAAAPDFLTSPLTIQSKKKRYDMEALLEFTRKDEATRAGAQRFSALLEQEAEMQRGDGGAGLSYDDDDDDYNGGGGGGKEGSAAAALREHILGSAGPAVGAGGGNDGGGEGGGADRMRIVRALERTEIGGDGRRYYFFEQKEPDMDVMGRKFPKEKAKGAWAILECAEDRARHFGSGFPYDIQKKLGNMPDEIFLWVLDEVCSERRKPLQVEYRKLLGISHDQTQRLVSPTLLKQLFRNFGATRDVDELMARVTLREEASNPYPNRNWTCVENFLELLGIMSGHLSPPTRTTAMQILLRLGMDGIAVENFGYAQTWRRATDLVARSVPDEQWISFCQEVCSSMSKSTHKATMRWRAIVLLGPVVTPGPNTSSLHLQTRTLDLKRRLASVFFFDDMQRADKKPEDTVHIRAIIDRLEDNEFQINQNTDYKELGALMMLLNVALGDASRRAEMTAKSTSDFDAEVDELAEGLKSMLTRVAPLNKGIHVSRIEAKNAMELIRERLLYQVRIKSVPKIGIFGKLEEDTALPRQRDFMKGFLSRKKRDSSVKAEPDVAEGEAAIKRESSINVASDAIMAG